MSTNTSVVPTKTGDSKPKTPSPKKKPTKRRSSPPRTEEQNAALRDFLQSAQRHSPSQEISWKRLVMSMRTDNVEIGCSGGRGRKDHDGECKNSNGGSSSSTIEKVIENSLAESCAVPSSSDASMSTNTNDIINANQECDGDANGNKSSYANISESAQLHSLDESMDLTKLSLSCLGTSEDDSTNKYSASKSMVSFSKLMKECELVSKFETEKEEKTASLEHRLSQSKYNDLPNAPQRQFAKSCPANAEEIFDDDDFEDVDNHLTNSESLMRKISGSDFPPPPPPLPPSSDFSTSSPMPPSPLSTPQISNVKTVPGTPNSTTSQNPATPYLQTTQAQTMAHNFATEHRIFLRAILNLLNQRDQSAMEADVNDPTATIKCGTLRKASRGIKGLWRSKYVEIRKGMFSYFDNREFKRKSVLDDNNSTGKSERLIRNKFRSSMFGSQLRKDIPLRAATCTCRAVKVRSVKMRPNNYFGSDGAVFELRIEGGSRRLWMAETREERQSWMKAIHDAMLGASVTRGDNFLEYQLEEEDERDSSKTKDGKRGSTCRVSSTSPYKASLDKYLEIRSGTSSAQSKDDYLTALSSLRGKAITIPVQWIKSQLMGSIAANAFSETDVSFGVEQVWKDLLRDSVNINGEVLYGESFHGPDRIVGRITQQILSMDKSSHQKGANFGRDKRQTWITEAQAIHYARDILLASDRTRSGGDSYFCAENLCLNRELVVMCPFSTEANPISVSVCKAECEDGSNPMDDGNNDRDLSGWAFVRSSSSQKWNRKPLKLSRCVLMIFDSTDEMGRHERQSQLMLGGATVSNSSTENQLDLPSGTTFARTLIISNEDTPFHYEFLFEDELDYLLWLAALEKSCKEHARVNNHITNNGGVRTANFHSSIESIEDTSPTVDVVINVSTEYKLVTLDPEGIESEDTWAILRTTFIQKFRLRGGLNGHMFRGDETVQLELL